MHSESPAATTCEIIDFNAEWLHRRALEHMDANQWEMASYTSALLEGYLDGMWVIPRWEAGEPVFELSSKGRLFLPGGPPSVPHYEAPLDEQ